jgi:hypothetical protein
MKTLCTILVACAFAVALAACGDPTRVVAPEAPRYDGGTFTIGSGGRASTTTQADTTTAAPSPTETTADGTTAERGVFTAGSGG